MGDAGPSSPPPPSPHGDAGAADPAPPPAEAPADAVEVTPDRSVLKRVVVEGEGDVPALHSRCLGEMRE